MEIKRDTKLTISVALCTYNGEQYIGKQIDSILNQSYPVDEIIISDDSSTDNTTSIIQKYINEKAIPITLIKNKTNIGYRKNFWHAYNACKGDIIFFSDQDDIWIDRKVEVMLPYFEDYKYSGIFSDADIIDENDNPLYYTIFDSTFFSRYVKHSIESNQLFSILALGNNCVTGATLAVRKGSLHDFSRSSFIHDQYIALSLAQKGELYFVNQSLIKYRVHETQSIGLPSIPRSSYLQHYQLWRGEVRSNSTFRYAKRLRYMKSICREMEIDYNLKPIQVYLDKVKSIKTRINETVKAKGYFSKYQFCHFVSNTKEGFFLLFPSLGKVKR